ncbi:hypothetical protein [Streptomyces sp. SID10815]|uniref:DUF7144 family membrane protein n=1 Tax=Streptomyces sp. SID10815 TaxID=2706027 RepID=UPI00194310C1|nr:hypothetical protein [Streptomyces sp. SID10815]
MATTSGKVRPGQGGPGRGASTDSASLFAGAALMLSGPLSILLGVTGIAQDTLFSPPGYVYRFDLTAWGWLHLAIGLALVAAGLGILAGRSWGRGAGIAVAGVSLITQFMFIPYYPVWSIVVMVLDLVIVWALSRFHTAAPGGR